MTAARHRAPREHTSPRLGGFAFSRLVVPSLVAAGLTASVVGVAIGASPDVSDAPQASSAAVQWERPVVPADRLDLIEDRRQPVSRSARRVTLEERPRPVGHRFSTTALKVRTDPRQDSRHVAVLAAETKLLVTGTIRGEWAEIVYDGLPYWVAADYLVKHKPRPVPKPKPKPGATPEATEATEAQKPTEPSEATQPAQPAAEADPAPVGVSTAPCPAGTSIESGIVSAAVTVYRTVCARFPTITSYGGWRGDGEHADGRAIDVMVSGDLGWQVAEFLRANASALGLYDIIYAQRIWTVDRSSEGWRYMEDRGSTTANHYDHVHVQVL